MFTEVGVYVGLDSVKGLTQLAVGVGTLLSKLLE